MTEPRTFRRNLAFSGLSAASNLLPLLLLYFATRTLAVGEYGVLIVAFAFAAIGEPLMDFGVHQASVRHIARDRAAAGDILANSLPLKAVSGLGMLVVLSVVALVRFPEAAPASMLMLVSAALRSYLLTVRGVLMGLEHFAHEAGVMLTDRVLMLAGGLVALHLGYGAVGIAASFVITRAMALAIALAIARWHVGAIRLAFDFSTWRLLRDAALPLGMFMMVLNVYNYVDVLLVYALTGREQTAFYGNAYRVYEGLTYAIAVLMTVLTPRFAALWKSDRAAHARLARRGLMGSVALGAAMTPAVWLLAPFVMGLLGPEYLVAIDTLRILAAGLGVVFAIWVLHSIAMSTFRASLLVSTTLVCTAVNIGLNLVLIPRSGNNGAAAATVAGEVVAVAMLVWGLRDVLLGRANAPQPGPESR